MTLTNLDIEENTSQLCILEAKLMEAESNISLRQRYIKYIQSQTTLAQEI